MERLKELNLWRLNFGTTGPNMEIKPQLPPKIVKLQFCTHQDISKKVSLSTTRIYRRTDTDFSNFGPACPNMEISS